LRADEIGGRCLDAQMLRSRRNRDRFPEPRRGQIDLEPATATQKRFFEFGRKTDVGRAARWRWLSGRRWRRAGARVPRTAMLSAPQIRIGGRQSREEIVGVAAGWHGVG